MIACTQISMSSPSSFEQSLVLQLCNGGALNERIKKQTPTLTCLQRLQITVGIARALGHLHSLNMIHRDVKTQVGALGNSAILQCVFSRCCSNRSGLIFVVQCVVIVHVHVYAHVFLCRL
jgi:serine/threonine protein kinase